MKKQAASKKKAVKAALKVKVKSGVKAGHDPIC
jgi:hypothetical protein